MIVRSSVVDFPSDAMRFCLVSTLLLGVAVAAAVPSRFGRALADAEQRDQLRSWQLDQLLPAHDEAPALAREASVRR